MDSGEVTNIVMCDQPPENQIHLQKEIVYVQPGYGKFSDISGDVCSANGNISDVSVCIYFRLYFLTSDLNLNKRIG